MNNNNYCKLLYYLNNNYNKNLQSLQIQKEKMNNKINFKVHIHFNNNYKRKIELYKT